jgi:hypothetical protein
MVGLGGHEIQEAHPGGLRIEHALVHVDINDLRAGHDLLARDVERRGVVAGLDELAEFSRAGDVGSLADVHEERVLVDVERLEPGKPALDGNGRNGPPLELHQSLAHETDVIRCRATAAAHDVDEAGRAVVAQNRCRLRRRLVILAESVRQSRIGIRANIGIGDL